MGKIRRNSFKSKEAPGPHGPPEAPLPTLQATAVDAAEVGLGAVEAVKAAEEAPSRATTQPFHEARRGLLDVGWGFREAHEMICGLTPLRRVGYEAQRAHPAVRWNPLYYVAVGCTVPCLVAGRRVHALFGQGEPLFEETEAEHEARVQWVYCMDGPYAAAGALAVVEALDAAMPRSFGGGSSDKAAAAYLLDCGISLGYVCGNVAFLEALRRRDLRATRTGIVANVSFGLALTLLLVLSLHRHDPARWSWNQQTKYAMRSSTVLFFVLAAMTYRTLWIGRVAAGAAADDRPPTTQERLRTLFYQAALSAAATLVWALFVTVLVMGDTKVVWDALA